LYDDVLYIPPVRAALRPWRLRLIERLRQLGTPLCVQALPGESLPRMGPDVMVWLDLSEVLLPDGQGGPSRAAARLATWLERNSGGSSWRGHWTVLPVLAGIIEPELDDIAQLLRVAGIAGALPLAPVLLGSQRRRLVAAVDSSAEDPPSGGSTAGREPEGEPGGEVADLYGALFHGPEPNLDFAAQRLAGTGLATLSVRPLPLGPQRLRARRDGAGFLMAVAEIQRRSGRAATQTQALVRSALWLDRHDLDLEGCIREGHLRLIEEVEAEAQALLGDWLRLGTAAALDKQRKASPSS
jgi:hypothetical protein